MNNLIPNEVTLDLIKKYEGLSLVPYLCPAGYWTVGYGHRCDRNQRKITKKEALDFLIEDTTIAMEAVLELCPNLIGDNRIGAITSFVFNLGRGNLERSTLRKRILEEDWDDVPNQLNRWVYATVNGKKQKLTGLVRRRAEEGRLFQMK